MLEIRALGMSKMISFVDEMITPLVDWYSQWMDMAGAYVDAYRTLRVVAPSRSNEEQSPPSSHILLWS